MRISDWSSDVCSSDLALGGLVATLGPRAPFIAAAILAGLNALAMLFLLPETLDAAHRRPFRLRDAHVIGAFRPLFEAGRAGPLLRSEEHTSELQSLMRISYAVFCLKKKTNS